MRLVRDLSGHVESYLTQSPDKKRSVKELEAQLWQIARGQAMPELRIA